MKYVIANWKMNPATCREAEMLVRAVLKVKPAKDVEVVLCAPFMYLDTMRAFLKPRTLNLKPHLGSQNCFWENPTGPYTGEISPAMLKNSDVEYVILGHSERRKFLGETDETVAKKAKAALQAGLKVVLCVGEPWEVRKKGEAAVRRFVERQLTDSLKDVPRPKTLNLKPKNSNLFVVYEPVWAISTSAIHRACDPDEAEKMVRSIRTYASTKLGFQSAFGIYGGSVNGENALGYLSRKYIDGVLPGAASLKSDQFRKIIEAAQHTR
jgi:triosephosphate isomerase (TIM)